MKIAGQLQVSPLKEGLNLLKVWPGHKLGRLWSRPVSVNLLITSRCNSRCATCDSWKLTDHANELGLDDFLRLAREIADMQIPLVTIGGGEPLLRPDLWDIVRVFKDAGRCVQLTTNALALRKDTRLRMYESGLDRVTVSVDSHLPEVYAKIRGVDGLPSVTQNLASLLQERPAHLEADTNTVLCSGNAATFLDTIDFLVGFGVSKVNVSAVTTARANYLMVETKDSLAHIDGTAILRIVDGLLERKRRTPAISASTAFIRGLVSYYERPGRQVYPCYAGYLTIDIFQDGSLHGCGNLPSFANIRGRSLGEIWESVEAQRNRTDMAGGRCPNCYLSCKMELAIAANPVHLPRFALDKLSSN